MNLINQLWRLQQIYRNENAYYDLKQDMHLYRIPADFPADSLKGLEQVGRMPNQMSFPQHDEIWDAFYALAETWTLTEAANAFIAGLWSAPFLWQSALIAKLLSQATPAHPFTPYAGSDDTCTVCGFRQRAVDATYLWYRRMTGSLPLDGDPIGYVFALQEMAKSKSRPVPTAYDLWTFRAILTVIRQMPPKAWWDSSVGINETSLEKILGGIDCSCVSLADRPVPDPTLPQTITGSLKQRKTTRKKLPASPDAGKGPAQAEDVYAVRVRDDAWVTVYCHEIEGKYVIIEYLDGIFSEMPTKQQIISAFRPRSNGRWQAKASGMDRTTGVKRIARNILLPRTDLAAPGRISYATAASLQNLASWCFPELL